MSSEWNVKLRGALQLATTLAERPDESFLYRKAATLIDTVPLETSIDAPKFQGGIPRTAFERRGKELRGQILLVAPKYGNNPSYAASEVPRR